MSLGPEGSRRPPGRSGMDCVYPRARLGERIILAIHQRQLGCCWEGTTSGPTPSRAARMPHNLPISARLWDKRSPSNRLDRASIPAGASSLKAACRRAAPPSQCVCVRCTQDRGCEQGGDTSAHHAPHRHSRSRPTGYYARNTRTGSDTTLGGPVDSTFNATKGAPLFSGGRGALAEEEDPS